LTGVANRRHFDQALEQAWEQALETGQGLSVALLDVDHFKRYNDHFGHQKGDECLRAVAAALEGAVRLRDSARESDLIARYGGEEFAAVLRTGEEHALMVAERLRSSVQKLNLSHPLSSTGVFVTISVGVASVRPGVDGSSALALCASADAALYRAKNEGRNRVVTAFAAAPEAVV
jgi:diguanylate cyclase (GGDEF)-like protein